MTRQKDVIQDSLIERRIANPSEEARKIVENLPEKVRLALETMDRSIRIKRLTAKARTMHSSYKQVF